MIHEGTPVKAAVVIDDAQVEEASATVVNAWDPIVANKSLSLVTKDPTTEKPVEVSAMVTNRLDAMATEEIEIGAEEAELGCGPHKVAFPCSAHGYEVVSDPAGEGEGVSEQVVVEEIGEVEIGAVADEEVGDIGEVGVLAEGGLCNARNHVDEIGPVSSIKLSRSARSSKLEIDWSQAEHSLDGGSSNNTLLSTTQLRQQRLSRKRRQTSKGTISTQTRAATKSKECDAASAAISATPKSDTEQPRQRMQRLREDPVFRETERKRDRERRRLARHHNLRQREEERERDKMYHRKFREHQKERAVALLRPTNQPLAWFNLGEESPAVSVAAPSGSTKFVTVRSDNAAQPTARVTARPAAIAASGVVYAWQVSDRLNGQVGTSLQAPRKVPLPISLLPISTGQPHLTVVQNTSAQASHARQLDSSSGLREIVTSIISAETERPPSLKPLS